MSDFEPFYDVSRSYEDNYEQGPFGAFAEALKDGNGADAAGTTSEGASEGALATVLGQPVNLRAPGAATRSRTCSPYTPSRRTVH